MRKTIGVWIWRMLVASALVSLAVPLLLWGFADHVTFRQLAINYLESISYALCIGTALTVMISGTWCRLSRMHVALRWFSRALLLTAGTAIGCLAAGLIMLAIYREHYGYWASFISSFKIGIVLSVFCFAFLTVYEKYKAQIRVSEIQLQAKELERERALKLATEARLSSLESRIHPHFLFNTINSVSSLIHDDPRRAEKMLSQMAELLRFSLDSAHRGLVPLAREMRIVEDYLEIEKARFGDRLRYKIQVSEAFSDIGVPPLSVQTLVENSVKYAVSARRKGGYIAVSAFKDGDRLLLQVSDDGPGFPTNELPAGHGLSNLQERLKALFGSDADLLMISQDTGSTVTVQVPTIGESGRSVEAVTPSSTIHA